LPAGNPVAIRRQIARIDGVAPNGAVPFER
jgi:hypothetical protein